MTEQKIGKISQILSSVVDVKFEDEHLPPILTALTAKHQGKTLTLEVVQHIGDKSVSVTRNCDVISTENPISVPVGKETLGIVFNVTGEPIDNKGEVKASTCRQIHQPPPSFTEQSTEKNY